MKFSIFDFVINIDYLIGIIGMLAVNGKQATSCENFLVGRPLGGFTIILALLASVNLTLNHVRSITFGAGVERVMGTFEWMAILLGCLVLVHGSSHRVAGVGDAKSY